MSVADAERRAEFEAYERRLADDLARTMDERRALQALLSAQEAVAREPSAENRERVVERAGRLRAVARIARSITANSTNRELVAADVAVADRAHELLERRRDVTRVIVAILNYQRDPSSRAQQELLDELERYSARP